MHRDIDDKPSGFPPEGSGKHKTAKSLAVVCSFLILTAFGAGAAELSYFGYLQASTGHYIFTERTNSLYFGNGLAVSVDPLRLFVSFPVILQNTSLVSQSGAGMIPSGGEHNEMISRYMGERMTMSESSGFSELSLGDPLVQAYLEIAGEGRLYPSVSLTASAKAPLADPSSGLGTGEWDFGAGISLVKRGGKTLLFLDLAYWIMGDMDRLDFHNPVAFSLGAGRVLRNGKFSLLASLYGYSRIVRTIDPPLQAGVSLSYLLASGRSLNFDIAVGLTNASPDLAAGMGWQIRL